MKLKNVFVVGCVVIGICFPIQSAIPAECDRMVHSTDTDSGDDGCWMRCSGGSMLFCEEGEWTLTSHRFTCLDVNEYCPNACNIATGVNRDVWTCVANCILLCPTGEYELESYTENFGTTYCFVCGPGGPH